MLYKDHIKFIHGMNEITKEQAIHFSHPMIGKVGLAYLTKLQCIPSY